MSTALNYFLNENRLIANPDAQDEAIDFAYLLDSNEWNFLAEKWEGHSEEWQREVTTYAGLVSLTLTAPLILRALHSTSPNVVLQALLSIYECIMVERYSEEYNGNISYTFSEENKNKILSEIALRISNDELPELEELKIIIENL